MSGTSTSDQEGHYCQIHCSEVFLPRSMALRAMWCLIGLALTLVGSSVTYALTTSSQLTKLQVISDQNVQDIKEIKGMQARIDDKLDIILGNVQENGNIIKGMLSVTP